MPPGQRVVWSFGFGSNMDVEALRTKKGLNVVAHTAAVLKGWRVAFTTKGPLVEPAFANAARGKGSDEIHGVAFSIPEDDVEKLD